jgi:site-specific recombinase XerD
VTSCAYCGHFGASILTLTSCSCPSARHPFSVDGAQKLIERLGVAAKLPFKIHAHMLRHAAGYALAARGVDTRTLQAFMGHRSIANTVIYTAVADKRIRNIWGK